MDYEFKGEALIEFLIAMTHLSNTVTWMAPLNVKVFPNGILAQVPHENLDSCPSKRKVIFQRKISWKGVTICKLNVFFLMTRQDGLAFFLFILSQPKLVTLGTKLTKYFKSTGLNGGMDLTQTLCKGMNFSHLDTYTEREL